MVDVATGWTECMPLVTRDGTLVVEAIRRVQSSFPWLLRGVDFDNDNESWLAVEPQLTALAIVGRLAERDPQQFGPKQHSIVQRLLRAIRRKATQQLIAEPASPALAAEESIIRSPVPVDGAAYGGPAPSTVPPAVPRIEAAKSTTAADL
jgi:hypothetical protein